MTVSIFFTSAVDVLEDEGAPGNLIPPRIRFPVLLYLIFRDKTQIQRKSNTKEQEN